MIVIIDYGMGNLRSVQKSFEFLGAKAIISNNEFDINSASKIVLPGVGAFGEGMQAMEKLNLIPLLNENVINKKKLFLGICLGLQLIGKKSFEHGEFNGLGWIDFEVRPLQNEVKNQRVPHMGWNDLTIDTSKNHFLFKNIANHSSFYFVHSYYAHFTNINYTIGSCRYGDFEFCAALKKDNIYATQFHPEKSQKAGLALLKNFIEE